MQAVDTVSDQLDRELIAYSREKSELEKHHLGKWVVFKDEELRGSFDTIDAAAKFAIEKFGRGPYLIRQVGAPPVTLPASVMYRPIQVA